MSNWYLVQTRPLQEFIAKQNLHNQGYETYCPAFKFKNKLKPLFSRYIFIKNNDQNLSPIRSTKGVSNFVRFGNEFAKMSDEVINQIKKQEYDTITKLIEQSKLHKGDRVEITEGAFKGEKAIFEKYSDEHRVILLLKFIHQTQQLKYKVSQIKVV